MISEIRIKLLPGEDWVKKFAGRCIENRPDWVEAGNKCKMCPRWHSKFLCFGDCANTASHVGKAKVTAEQKNQNLIYLQKIRA